MIMPAIMTTPMSDLTQWCQDAGQPAFRAKQIWQWIIQRRVVDFDQMTDLPLKFREQLADHWTVFSTRVVKHQQDGDHTQKVLLQFSDDESVESVLIVEGTRRTVCLSTQVGCGMRCAFCASGLSGLTRNLTTVEIKEQLLWLQSQLPIDQRLSHIVVMGMGEPLANLSNLLPALDWATTESSKMGLGISARHVTVSTVGLPKKIRELAQVGKPYHLAVSLHAPNNDLRQEIIPMAEKVDLADLIAATDEYRKATGRQVTFEYTLLGEVNDHPHHARQLVQLIGRRDAMINLIPYNPVDGLGFVTPAVARTEHFARILTQAGHVAKVRRRKGSGIDAACGQLRRRHSAPVMPT